MNRTEINHFEMMKSVEKLLSENAALIENQPTLVQAHIRLRTLCDEIYTINSRQTQSTTGLTAQKTEGKTLLVALLVRVNDTLKAYAAATADVKLKAETDISASEIARLRDNDLAIRSQAIYVLAQPLAAELAGWGVTAADIDALNTNNQTLLQKTPAIRTVRAVTVQATAQLKEKLKETATLLKETLDPMMLPFKNLNPSFHGEYLNARTIIDRTATQTPTPPKEG
jgi:hypothetical protein